MDSMSNRQRLAEIFDADELLALARHDIENNRLEQALEKLKCVLAGAVPADEALALAARVYGQLGLFQRAQEALLQYLARHPDAPNEQFQLGMSYYSNGQLADAQGHWDAILHAHPTYPPALYYGALALARQGKPMEAKRSLGILLQSAAPDNLYAGKGRELLQSIDAGLQASFIQSQQVPSVGGAEKYQ
jgi:tetratricopeptide (TPR) repeat protein